METRKVQITGGSTFIVSLPKQWAKDVGIEGGSPVTILRRPDDTLVISPGIERIEQRGRLNINGLYEEDLDRAVIGEYLAGYDLIELRAKRITSDQKMSIRRICQKLIGPEIIEETSDRVLIQDLLKPSDLPIDKTVWRMYMITITMHRDVIRALRGMDIDLARDVASRDDEVDRLNLLIAKQLKIALRRVHITPQQDLSLEACLDLRLAANTLERLADHATRMADVLIELDGTTINEQVVYLIEDASQRTHAIIECAIESLFNRDMAKANTAISMQMAVNDIIRRLDESLLDLDANTAVALGTLADSIERSADYGANIAEIAINTTLSNHPESV